MAILTINSGELYQVLLNKGCSVLKYQQQEFASTLVLLQSTILMSSVLIAAGLNYLFGGHASIISSEDESDDDSSDKRQGVIRPEALFGLINGSLPDELLQPPTKTVTVGTGRTFPITVDGSNNSMTTVNVDSNTTVHDVKKGIERCRDIKANKQAMFFKKTQLEDERKLSTYEIERGSILYFIVKSATAGQSPHYLLDKTCLDPRYDYDFTHECDDGRVYKRGSHTYKRPYGWKRIALKVKGKYENDTWLGPDGIRTESAAGEWPVSYHGSKQNGIQGIVKEGYDMGRAGNGAFGKGLYSTPDIDVAATYAITFKYEGKEYKMVLQNRVNMSGTKEVAKEKTGAGAEFYVTSSSNNLRPYGVCVKEI